MMRIRGQGEATSSTPVQQYDIYDSGEEDRMEE